MNQFHMWQFGDWGSSQTWLVLGWVTKFRWPNHQYFTNPARPTHPPTLSETGNEYQPKWSDALRLVSKGRHGSFHLWTSLRVAVKSV